MTVAPAVTELRPAVETGWRGAFRDLPREHGFEPLRVEGTLPADLEGVLYKNGIGRVECHGERYRHWFDGDGAVTGVRFQGGRALGAVRLVRTPAFEREARAGRRLFGAYNTPLKRPIQEAFLRDHKNVANTSVMLWQGRLFALAEGGRPFEIDRDTLGTAGERDLGGVVTTTAFSAHPHLVPQRRALYGFGIANGPETRVAAYELPHQGRARKIAELRIPGPTMVHDFAATERYLIFTFAPMRIRVLPMLLGRAGAVDAMEWRSEQGTEIAVVPIDDPAAAFRVTVDAHLSEHVVNAFDQGDTVQFDFIRYADLRGLEDYVGGLAAGAVRAPLQSSVCRGIVDVKARKVRFEQRLAAPCELPRVSPRVDAAPYRFAYLAGFSSDAAARRSFFDAILKLDVERGSVEKIVPGPGHSCGEAVFVPKRNGTAEDDGYLVSMAYDAATDRSYAAVFDARAPGAPPLARAYFDHAIPPGFHGTWAD